jgi:hypothetical protein
VFQVQSFFFFVLMNKIFIPTQYYKDKNQARSELLNNKTIYKIKPHLCTYPLTFTKLSIDLHYSKQNQNVKLNENNTTEQKKSIEYSIEYSYSHTAFYF